jgi:CheY-like chemotaxis protein
MRKLRILLVEDDAVIATLLAEMLESLGHSVCAIAATQADAVSEAVYHRPEFMIVDAQLREGSGISAMRTISRQRATPHLFVSAASIRPCRPDAILLRKPFRELELVGAIGRALSLASSENNERTCHGIAREDRDGS